MGTKLVHKISRSRLLEVSFQIIQSSSTRAEVSSSSVDLIRKSIHVKTTFSSSWAFLATSELEEADRMMKEECFVSVHRYVYGFVH